jgi:hypothetical protein
VEKSVLSVFLQSSKKQSWQKNVDETYVCCYSKNPLLLPAYRYNNPELSIWTVACRSSLPNAMKSTIVSFLS